MKSKKKESIPRRIYDFFIKNWWLTALIISLPGHVLVFVEIAGPGFGLQEPISGALTIVGCWIFFTSYVSSILFSVAKAAADRYNSDVKYDGQYVLQNLLGSVTAVVQKKQRRFIEYIAQYHKKERQDPFQKITQPKEQIDGLLENIQGTLSEIFGLVKESIGLSVIFKTDESAEWERLCTLNISDDLSLRELVDNPRTSARQIIDGKKSFIFFADKNVAKQENMYVDGKQDEKFNGKGSIICQDISFDSDHKYMQAVLTVCTYGDNICKAREEAAIAKKLQRTIIPVFAERIRLELALLYIKRHIANQSLSA